MINQNLLLAGDDGYNLTNSLRFRSSASAYLNRTPASAGSLTTWTWSGWVKRGALGGTQCLFNAGPSVATTNTYIGFATDYFYFANYVSGSLNGYIFTNSPEIVFRDPAAWYHIVAVWDTTNATAANRMQVYINGVLVVSGTPSQNTTSAINAVTAHRLGLDTSGNNQYFDGYLTEVNFIDGQALTPSSFGSTNALTGVWQPAKYTGTYGTNGFYLPFTDNSALTTSSNVGLGKDFSGNGNYWTTNNISITAGATYDSMTDVPTLTSATTANYCVINPLVYRNSVGQNGYSNGNLTLSGLGAAVAYFNMATMGIAPSSGKFYWECQIGTASSGSYTGVTQDSNFQSGNWDAWYDSAGGVLYKGGTSFASVATATTNDVIGIAYDSTANTCAFYKNNTLLGTVTGLTSATMFPLQCARTSSVLNLNFGQRPFSYTPPTGFVALNTFNLSAPTINNGAAYMAATIWNGDGTTSRSISTAVNGVSFQPDFVWVKARNNAREHILEDSVRGLSYNNQLSSNSTGAESSNPSAGGVTGSSSTTITLGGTGAMDNVNRSTWTYVGWQWKAGGTAVTNTAGTISAQVSANTTSGFSVVTYTGTGASATVGHGLGVAPSMIIAKSRSTVANWQVYHRSIPNMATGFIMINSTAAFSTATSQIWNSTAPTSTVFSLGTDTDINGSANTIVAYCFTPIAGYSAFGSYTGNGSTDGTFVYTGFRPRFVMWKNSTQASQWILLDSARNTYNVANAYLEPNTSDSENTASTVFDMLSNGFKLRNSGGTDFNENANNYIYMAFAENPFKNALAR